MDDIPDGLQAMAENQDVAERMAATLSASEFPKTASRLVALQLVGGVPIPTNVGADHRGDIHLLVVAPPTYGTSEFVSRVAAVAPNSSVANGATATRSGVVGSTKGGELTAGPIGDSDVELTILHGFDMADSGVHETLGEILAMGTFTVVQNNTRDSFDAPGSVLLLKEPEYGTWSEYEPIPEQAATEPRIVANVDALVPCVGPAGGFDGVEPLDEGTATDLVTAAQSVSPDLEADAVDRAGELATAVINAAEEESPLSKEHPGNLQRSILRLGAAQAKYRLSPTVKEHHVQRGEQLLRDAYEEFWIVETGEFDVDVVSTDNVHERNGVKFTDRNVSTVKQYIGSLEEEYDDGAPIEEITAAEAELDMDSEEIAAIVDHLRHIGETYEPVQGHLRTT